MPGTCARCSEPRGRNAYCREHDRQRRREKRQDPEYRRALRNNTLRFKYGIEPEEFDRRLTEQGGHCAICPATTDLCVDHNHVTGKVRGILCRHCNAGLGQFRDDLVRLREAVKYLERG